MRCFILLWQSLISQEAYSVARQFNLIPPMVEQAEYNMFQREKVECQLPELYHKIGESSYRVETTPWIVYQCFFTKWAKLMIKARQNNRNSTFLSDQYDFGILETSLSFFEPVAKLRLCVHLSKLKWVIASKIVLRPKAEQKIIFPNLPENLAHLGRSFTYM